VALAGEVHVEELVTVDNEVGGVGERRAAELEQVGVL